MAEAENISNKDLSTLHYDQSNDTAAFMDTKNEHNENLVQQ